MELFTYESRIKAPPDAGALDTAEPLTVRFERLSFRYRADGPWVLAGVSFSPEAGTRLALVGENGSGKTTPVKLPLRFYDATEGRILVKGTALRQIDLGSYGARIGAIFQDFARYEGRIRQQIGYGDLERLEDLDVIQQAAPDPEAEKRFLERLLREVQGKGIIFISHRFSAVRRADRRTYGMGAPPLKGRMRPRSGGTAAMPSSSACRPAGTADSNAASRRHSCPSGLPRALIASTRSR